MGSLYSEFHLDGTLGAVVIAGMVTSALYGITTIQSYLYFHRAANDSSLFKIIIAILWVLDTAHQVFLCHLTYTYTVVDYGNILALTTEVWSVYATVYVTAIMNLCVRSIFCFRVWRFSNKNWYIAAIIMISTLSEFGGIFAFIIQDQTVIHGKFAAQHDLSVSYYIGSVFSTLSDFLIVASQVTYLLRCRSKVPRTNSIIRTMIIYTINTGLVTALCALSLTIVWATMSNNLVYVALFAALPTLLFNALLATLNARQELREIGRNNGALISIPLSTIAPTSSEATADVQDQGSHMSNWHIHVTKEVEVDKADSV